MPETILGTLNKKDYFLHLCAPEEIAANENRGRRCKFCLEDGNEVIIWRVPDPRESVRARSGFKIFSADFSQIEVKIMTWLSQDPFLKAAINSGKDIHCYMTSEIYEIPYELVYKAYKDKKHPRHDEFTTMRSNVKTQTFKIQRLRIAICG